ncbi:MAG: hypothetical protein IKS51_08205 [Erysipelotrichaceae bacterium]|nr:hypothetical protein [Erysipelotrichaceae bacterium]
MNKKKYSEKAKQLSIYLRKAVICLAVFVVFITSYMMTLPAVAISKNSAVEDPAIVLDEDTLSVEQEQEETSDGTDAGYDPFTVEEEREEEIGQQADPETTETVDEEADAEEKNEVITFFDDSTDITVYVEAPLEAFPEGTTMVVTPIESEEVLDAVSNTLDAETTIRRVVAVDITFFDKDGNEIEPACEIKVSLVSDMIKESREAQIVHIDDNGEGTLVEQSQEESQNDEVIFESKEFSTYAIVIIETFYIDSEGETYKVTVTYDENSNIPANAVLDVREITSEDEEFYSYCNELKETITDEIRYLRLFDISIIDEDGNKIQPENDVNVKIALQDYEKNDELNHNAVHFNEDGELDLIDVELSTEEEVTSVEFETDGFSVYAVVDTETITAEYLTADGETYLISVTYGPEAEIPEGAVLSVSEIESGTEAYEEYIDLTAENLEVENGDIEYARFFDISILKDGEEIQPKAPVNVRIELAEGLNSYAEAIHFGEETEKLDSEVTDTENEDMESAIVFETDGFSVYAVVQISSVSELDGNSYGIMNTKDGSSPSGIAMMNSATDSNTKLSGKTTTVRINTIDRLSMVYVAANSNITMWTLKDAGTGDNRFYITTVTGSGSNVALKYLQISSSGISLVSDAGSSEDCKIKITRNSSGKFKLSTDHGVLKLNGSKFERAGTSTNDASVWMDFAELSNLNDDDFQPYTAMKVGISGTITTTPTEKSTLLDNGTYVNYDVNDGDLVVLYTRIWNGTKYDYYVFDYDGVLVKAYESGDTISWVGSKRDTTSWVFTEYKSTKTFTSGTFLNSDGEMVTAKPEQPFTAKVPNYYYEFQNDYSKKYIVPKAKGDTVIGDGTIGVNLNGRRYLEYYSTMLAWDASAYDYGTLAIKQTGNWRLVPRPMSQAIPVYFAKVTVETSTDTLTPVATIDHSSYGITLKIQDYERINQSKNRSQEQLDVLGDTPYVQWYGTKNLLRRNLEDDGYPLTNKNITGTSAQHSLHELYDSDRMITIGQQFLLNTYNETGYFEYDSTQNFAHLIWQDDDPWIGQTSPSGKAYEKGDFVIYDQIGTTTDGGATREHGQFFPFNDLVEGQYVTWTNNTDIHANPLSSLDPRKGEKLYAVQYVKGQSIAGKTYAGSHYQNDPNKAQILDHFFGMEMSASFMQSESGLDAWGHDLIFEFSGDDDFWFYVDGVLILDLGGIHSALDGSINFRTGVVKYTKSQNEMETTNLRALYELAYKEKNPKASGVSQEDYQATVDAYLNEIFKDDGSNTGTVFKDYSGHTMKMFYMERGCGASNLHMRFNLAPYQEGAVELEKVVTGSDSITMPFPFQVWYEDPTNHVMDLAGKEGYPVTVIDAKTKVRLPMQSSYTIDGMTYHNVFLLSAGQTVLIQLPSEDTKYYIKECLVDDATFGVPTVTPDAAVVPDPETGRAGEGSINHTNIEIADEDAEHSTLFYDYWTPITTVKARKKVVFENHVKKEALKSLNITKKLWKFANKTGPISASENGTQFKYRIFIGKDADNKYVAYNTGKYYVKDPDGYYCYHDEVLGFVKFTGSHIGLDGKQYNYGNGVTDIEDLDKNVPADEPYKSDYELASFYTSPGGAIDEIKAGYTVEIPELLSGMAYQVMERSDEIPTGYNLLGYTYRYYDGEDYTAPVDCDGTGIIYGDRQKEEIFVHNQHGYGLRVNKIWSDAEFMASHDVVYYAIYECTLDENLDPVSYSATPLANSVRALVDPYTSITWFFEELPDGISVNNYHIFEVDLTVPEGGTITVNPTTGVVSGYSAVIRKEEGDTIQVGGTSSEQGYSADTTYTVGYSREKVSLSAIAREDTVYNSRPGIKLIKTDMSSDPDHPQQGALQGAVFTLSKVGEETKEFTSDENGLIAMAYLKPGKEYTLTEISTPEGYLSLINNNQVTIKIQIDSETGIVTLYVNGEATDPEDGYYFIHQVTDEAPTMDNMPSVTIKNKPYELKAVKIDSYSGQPLPGVHFALYKEVYEVGTGNPMPDYVPVKGYEDIVSGPDGLIEGISYEQTEFFDGLKAGTYYLREVTPTGYNPLGVDIRITISSTGNVTIEGAKRPGSSGGSWTISPISSSIAKKEFTESDEGNTCLITIYNKPNDPVRIRKMKAGTSGNNTVYLEGIKFDYYDETQIANGKPKPGEVPRVSGATAADGILILGGVEDNTSYYLYETETLPGYQLLSGPVIVTAIRSNNTLTVKASLNGQQLTCKKVKDSNRNDVWEISIYNSTGYELPASGGTGRSFFYITGACMIVAAMLLQKRTK